MIRNVLVVAVLALGGAAVWMGFAGPAWTADKAAQPAAGKAAPFVHAVIFHLKQDAPKDEVEALITDAHKLLRPIPSVRGLRIGRPAEKGTPEFGKKDFAVGLLVLFDDSEGLHAYLNHPMHLKYVEQHAQYLDTSNLLVYDFVDQKK